MAGKQFVCGLDIPRILKGDDEKWVEIGQIQVRWIKKSACKLRKPDKKITVVQVWVCRVPHRTNNFKLELYCESGSTYKLCFNLIEMLWLNKYSMFM